MKENFATSSIHDSCSGDEEKGSTIMNNDNNIVLSLVSKQCLGTKDFTEDLIAVCMQCLGGWKVNRDFLLSFLILPEGQNKDRNNQQNNPY